MTSLAPTDPALDAAGQAAELGALAAAGAFGANLRATPEFTGLLAAVAATDADPVSASAIESYQALEAELRVEATMNLLTDEQADELERLRVAMYATPSVEAYVLAVGAFGDLCRETASVVTAGIGIDFAANSRSGGCCGG